MEGRRRCKCGPRAKGMRAATARDRRCCFGLVGQGRAVLLARLPSGMRWSGSMVTSEDFFGAGEGHGVGGLLHPGFDGELDAEVRAVFVFDLDPGGEDELSVLLDGDVGALGGVCGVVVLEVLGGHVQGPVELVPAAPEVAEIFAAFGLHLAEEV